VGGKKKKEEKNKGGMGQKISAYFGKRTWVATIKLTNAGWDRFGRGGKVGGVCNEGRKRWRRQSKNEEMHKWGKRSLQS